MPVEFVGMIGTRPASELSGPAISILGGTVDREFTKRFVRVHEDADFDRVLIGYGSTGPDGWSVASYAASVSDRLGYLLAHRPGFVAPTLAARMAATLDHFSDGRLALHIISGGSDAEQRKDGDWLDHDARYRRTDEYLSVLRRVWTSDKPFDHEGEFYTFKGAFSEVKPAQGPTVPLFFGGASGVALEVGARHADVYATWGEPLAEVKALIGQVRDAARAYGREPRISVSFRPILGATTEQAWERAHSILGRIREVRGGGALPSGPARQQSVGSQRLLAAAAAGEVHDRCLWTPIAAAVGATGNTTALVGTPETVAQALLDYYDLGVTTILIRGFDPVQDAIDYGRDLIPLVRAEVARRERQAVGVG